MVRGTRDEGGEGGGSDSSEARQATNARDRARCFQKRASENLKSGHSSGRGRGWVRGGGGVSDTGTIPPSTDRAHAGVCERI